MRWVAVFLLGVGVGVPSQAADIWESKARKIIEHLVNIPTVEGRGRGLEIAKYMARQFQEAKIPGSDIKVMPYADTAALIVRWRAASPAKKPIMVMAHMDVVEARRDDWSMDPFKFVERDGYLYGRGSSDNKAGVTATAVAVMKLKASGFKPNRDIIVFYTGDEETTGIGAKKGATEWKHLLDAEFGLNSDGGGGAIDAEGRVLGFGLQSAEKTYSDYAFTVRNPGGHSSKPRADNAIYQLASALKRLEAYRFEPTQNETTRAYFSERQKTEPGALGDAMRAWLSNPKDGKAADMIEADPNETGLTRTRCVATRLEGGHANNALPQLARATVNCRIMPGVSPDLVRDELQRVVADAVVEVSRISHEVSSLASPLRDDVVRAFTNAVRARFPNAPILPEMSTGASDAGPFRVAGIPIYGVDGTWGVFPGDMRAHGRDERVAEQALYDDVNHWVHMLTELAR